MHNELTTKMTFYNSNNILHGFDTRFNKMSVRDDNDRIKLQFVAFQEEGSYE